jgi:hypothetical protein
MGQHKGKKKRASEVSASRIIKEQFLMAVGLVTFIVFIIEISEIWLSWQIMLSILFLNLALLIGLVVFTAKSDSELQTLTGSGDQLRGAFFIASGCAILGLISSVLYGRFEFLYYLGTIAVVTLTILRAKNESNSDSGSESTVVNKPSGLL